MSTNEQSLVVRSLGERWQRTARNEDIGEEFLHMHHVMTQMVKDELRRHGCDMYPAWVQPPEDNDGQQVVTYDTNSPQTGGLDQMRRWHETSMNINLIKTRQISLGAFGTWLEDNLHNNLHSRHADPNGGIRFDFSQISLSNLPRLSDPINGPSNNWLAHPYSAHVNPYFWSLHGYVDEKIYNWLEANGYDGLENDTMVHDRTRTCDPSRDRCYRWRRTWDGLEAASDHRVSDAGNHSMSHGLSASEVDAWKKIPVSIQRMIHMNSHMIPSEGEIEFSH